MKAAPTEIRYIASNIRRLRTTAGLSQAELAEAAGISVVRLSGIERANADLYVGTFIAIAKALKVKPAVLLEPTRFEKAKRGRPKKTA